VITYSTNMMGPWNIQWYAERGLTRKATFVVTTDVIEGYSPGDVVEYDKITTHYAGGRIDIRDDTKEGYEGWDEYSVAPMHQEDWNKFGGWLWNMQTEELWSYEKLIEHFQYYNKAEIRWAKCLEEKIQQK
jgi:hypothetical protein